MIMKNAKNKTTKTVETKTVETKTKLLTVADVARELNIAPKRLRAMLRKNAKQYAAFRKQRFERNSDAHKNATKICKSLLSPAAAA